MNKIKIVLGIFNIIVGLLYALIIFLMQGLIIFLLGFVYIFFGITILNNKPNYKFLFCAVIPVTVLFSFFIIMLGIDKDIPRYTQTPLGIGIIILIPFWLVTFVDVLFTKRSHSAKLNMR